MIHQISVPLSPQEFEALRNVSQSQLRHPREQARYILRSVLLGEQPPVECRKPAAASIFHTETANGFVGSHQPL